MRISDLTYKRILDVALTCFMLLSIWIAIPTLTEMILVLNKFTVDQIQEAAISFFRLSIVVLVLLSIGSYAVSRTEDRKFEWWNPFIVVYFVLPVLIVAYYDRLTLATWITGILFCTYGVAKVANRHYHSRYAEVLQRKEGKLEQMRSFSEQ